MTVAQDRDSPGLPSCFGTLVCMTDDPGPMPIEKRQRSQLHVWVDSDVAEWLRARAYRERMSRGKTVEAILRRERAREAINP